MRARLSDIPFNYLVHPYTFNLADYFVRGSKIQPRVEEIGVGDSTVDELQHMLHHMQMGDDTPSVSNSVMIAPPSPDRASLFSLCFPDETTNYGVVIELADMIDGVVPHDEYHDEMDMLGISQFLDAVQRELFSSLDLFRVSVIEIVEENQTAPTPELPAFVIPTIDMYEGTISPIERVSKSVDPPFSFDILSGFVTCSDYVSNDSVMDLNFYEYSFVSCNDVLSLGPYSSTSQILDIDDEIAQHDSDERATPTVRDVEIVDFNIVNQPRELKIGSPLSTDERDNLIHLLRSYLDVFAWSYENMPGLHPSIVQHHLAILPHARPGSVVADHLASLPTIESRPVDDDFPNEEFVTMTRLSGWCMYFDGATNHSRYGISVLLVISSTCNTMARRRYLMNVSGSNNKNPLRPKGYQVFTKLKIKQNILENRQWNGKMKGPNFASCLPKAISSSFQLQIVHGLKRWILDFLSFDMSVMCMLCHDHSQYGVLISLDRSRQNLPLAILVAIDYFTKWVEAASYAKLTYARVANFIRSHIICRYGVPRELISDRGAHFRVKVETLLQKYGIQHHKSSAYRS
uniref:Integrase catalytic domain-containing protein n=1 Tax=Vitis vinifera TaxID=29760 RepID=A5AM27_VITVI|nr:hypothetical protein VITISV_012550 [Vitis vinifera]